MRPQRDELRTNRPARGWLLPIFLLLFESGSLAQSKDWPQWGGPNRNFKTSTTGLAASWPADGPRRLWSRELGEGFSAIAAEPSATQYALRTFLRVPHPTMPNFILKPDDIDDIVAHITSLKPQK